jgi:hypothetical protein
MSVMQDDIGNRNNKGVVVIIDVNTKTIVKASELYSNYLHYSLLLVTKPIHPYIKWHY